MIKNWMNGLILMEIHEDIEPNGQQLLDKFVSSNRRKDLIRYYVMFPRFSVN